MSEHEEVRQPVCRECGSDDVSVALWCRWSDTAGAWMPDNTAEPPLSRPFYCDTCGDHAHDVTPGAPGVALSSPLEQDGRRYRGRLIAGGSMGAVLVLEEYIERLANWHATPGRWYVRTLSRDPCDSIAIDYGAGWVIERGMLALIDEAQRRCFEIAGEALK